MAQRHDLSVLDWSPLGGGALTGKVLQPDSAASQQSRVGSGAVARITDKYQTEQGIRLVQTLVQVAQELGCSAAQLALAWLRHRSDSHISMIGARTTAQIEANLAAAEVKIPAEAMARLNATGGGSLGFPMDFLRAGQQDWQGEQLQRLDTRGPSQAPGSPGRPISRLMR